IKTGRLRALAVTTATRSPALPDIPTVGEFVTGYEAITFHGIGAPKGTPPTSSIEEADIRHRPADVRFTPKSGHGQHGGAARRGSGENKAAQVAAFLVCYGGETAPLPKKPFPQQNKFRHRK